MTSPEFFCILSVLTLHSVFEVDFATQEPLTDRSRVRSRGCAAISPRTLPCVYRTLRAPVWKTSRAQMERDMAKKANQARQADLKRDTEKLLKLATELKESVDKTNEGTLSST